MSRNIKSLKAVAPPEGEVLPVKSIGRPGNLNTIKNVRIEAARIYRRICEGHIEPEIGTKLFFMLDRLGRLVGSETIEARIEIVEHTLMKGRYLK